METGKTERQFTEAYETHHDEIFRFCLYRVFDRELAVDLTQETFIKTWHCIVRGDDINNIRAFLYRVARNLVIDNSRKKKTESLEDLAESGFEPSSRGDHKILEQIAGNQARAALVGLESIYREVLLLRYVDDLSPKEIAVLLDETPNVVSVRLNRGVKKLRELLDK